MCQLQISRINLNEEVLLMTCSRLLFPEVLLIYSHGLKTVLLNAMPDSGNNKWLSMILLGIGI